MRSPELTLYFMLLMSTLCFFRAVPLFNSPDNMLQIKGDRNIFFGAVLSLVLVWWFGHRQYFGGGFQDTANYAYEYINTPKGIRMPDFKGEWLWNLIVQICVTSGFSVKTYFTIIEAGYILPLIPALKKILPSNPYLGLLFVFSSLFFLPFGVNGIRNGLACNVLFLGFAYILESRYVPAVLISLFCISIHRSAMLPLTAFLFAVFYYRDVKTYIYMWFVSIVLSLLFGEWFIEFFSSLGFDDRMAQYTQEVDANKFSHTGFRWDFLLYSSVPVFFCWYVCVKKGISDNWYNAICSTYLMCNAFWVLVIRASYSNRFAYLSWFIFPLVIVYPLVLLPVWHDQDNRTGMILLAYIAFTFLMNFIWQAF